MTKTQRRRSAHAARIATSTTSVSTASDLLSDHQWRPLQLALVGLLAIEFPSPFTDTKHLCPEQAYLVVHLDRLRGSANVTNNRRRPAEDFEHRVARVLDALATLCATAQQLSVQNQANLSNDSAYLQYWTRVCLSDVLDAPAMDSTQIQKWVRHTQVYGISVLLSWSDKPIEFNHFIEPLRKLFTCPRVFTSTMQPPPVTIGLRFVACAMSTSAIQSLHALLSHERTNKEDIMRSYFLVDTTSLQTLWLDDNPLYTGELTALAVMLGDKTTRCIDELRLESFLTEDSPLEAVRAPEFFEAFQRVITAALTSQCRGSGTEDTAFSLSLAGNRLDSNHLAFVLEALQQASRSLRALSFADVQFPTRNAWDRLGRILFTPLPIAAPDALLDLSRIGSWDYGWQDNNTQGITDGLQVVVSDAIQRVCPDRELRNNQLIECRLKDAVLHRDPQLEQSLVQLQLDSSTFFRVCSLDKSTLAFQVTVISADSGDMVTGWVDLATVRQLRVDGVDMVHSGFTRLVCDAEDCYENTMLTLLLPAVTAGMGDRLASLSLRDYYRIKRRRKSYPTALHAQLPKILADCPRLQELILDGSVLGRDDWPLWISSSATEDSTAWKSSVRVLSLNHCPLHGKKDPLRGFNSALPRLQRLALQVNRIGADGIASVLAMLRENNELTLVELTPQFDEHESFTPVVAPTARCHELRLQIEQVLYREYLHIEEKVAFLSVLMAMQKRQRRVVYMGNDVVALVFQYTGTTPPRAVSWSY